MQSHSPNARSSLACKSLCPFIRPYSDLVYTLWNPIEGTGMAQIVSQNRFQPFHLFASSTTLCVTHGIAPHLLCLLEKFTLLEWSPWIILFFFVPQGIILWYKCTWQWKDIKPMVTIAYLVLLPWLSHDNLLNPEKIKLCHFPDTSSNRIGHITQSCWLQFLDPDLSKWKVTCWNPRPCIISWHNLGSYSMQWHFVATPVLKHHVAIQ